MSDTNYRVAVSVAAKVRALAKLLNVAFGEAHEAGVQVTLEWSAIRTADARLTRMILDVETALPLSSEAGL